MTPIRSPFQGSAAPAEMLDNAIAFAQTCGDRHERRAVFSTAFIGLCGTGVPVSLIVGERYAHFVFGLLVPSTLALLATLVSTWATLIRPFEKWRLFRRVQFISELERARYQRHLPPYAGPDRDERLLAYIDDTTSLLLDAWGKLLPTPEDLARLVAPPTSPHQPAP